MRGRFTILSRPPARMAGADPGRLAAELLREVDPQDLRAALERLSRPRSRIHHPEGMRAAEEQVLEGLARAGWEAERRPFRVAAGIGIRDHGGFGRLRYRGLHGANVVAVKPGAVPEALVLLAHLDAVRDSPGANDNGASVVALLEVARLLAPATLGRTVVLAVTDLEEVGLFGARHLVTELRAQRPLAGAINLETIAYVDRRPGTQRLPAGIGAVYRRQVAALARRGTPGDFTALIHDGRARELTATYAEALAQVAGPEVPVPLRAPGGLARYTGLLIHAIPMVRDFARGDHAAFWAAGVPALQVTDTANFRSRAYHGPQDTPERLDYERLAQLVAATAATLRASAAV